MSADLPQSFLKAALKSPLNVREIGLKKSLKFFSIHCNISAKYSLKYFQNLPKNSQNKFRI